MAESPFVAIDEVANYFVVSVATVRKWLRNGTIPSSTYFKVGNTYRFNLQEVQAALVNAPKEPVQLELNLGEPQ